MAGSASTLALAGALLALAAFGQAIAQAFSRPGRPPAPGWPAGPAVALGLWRSRCGTVPLLFLRPACGGRAAAITAASVLALIAFGAPTAAGLVAQVIASYRLGWTAGFGRAGRRSAGGAGSEAPPGGPGCPARRGRAGGAVPGARAGVPRRGDGGAARLSAPRSRSGPRSRGGPGREEARQSAARAVLADTLTEHLARGERARIARELHDVVAHHISMIAVQAETARLTTPGLPAAGAQRFAEIGDTARAGLTEMRRLLGVLREDASAGGPAGGRGSRSRVWRSWPS